MAQLYFKNYKILIFYILLIICQYSYSQTSNLWVTLKPNAGGTSQVNEDITINNGFTIVDKSSSSVSCVQSTINNDLVYAITFNGSDVDRDGVNDPISFDLKIKGHKGATYNYSTTANASSVTNYGTQSDVTVINNSWGIFGDYDVDAGESLVYTIENVVINGLSTAFDVKSKFTKVDVFETNGGRDHLMIFGFGSNLPSLEIDSDKSVPLSNYDTFSITGAGSFYAGIREWAISTLTFNIKITGPDTTSLDLTDYSSFENGPTFYHDYPAQTVQKSKLPNFSWNKVPRWVAARNSDAFSEQQINDIANNYQLIMLEKANNQGFEYIEDGIKNAATRLKAVNPKLTTLFYYNTYINYFGYKANIEYNQNAAAWSTYETNPTTGAQQIYLFKDLYYWYNQDVEGMRNWWINTCVEMANHEAIDGVFVDKISNPNDHGDAFDANGNPVNNYVKMLNDLHNQLPTNKLLVGNTLRNERTGGERDIMEIMDGSYLERWQLPSTGQSDADAVAVSIQLMREALQKGKMINLQSGPNDPLPTNTADLLAYTKQQVYFPLAVFLIIAEENAYFGYNAGVDAKSSSGNLWDTSFIDEFHYFLGQPSGAPTKNGYIYERSFENLDLWVNIETKETVFHWKDKTVISVGTDLSVKDTNFNTTIKLSPNPVKDNFSLSEKITTGVIYNVMGQKVMTFTENKSQYDVSQLQKGVYLIKVTLENNENRIIRFMKN